MALTQTSMMRDEIDKKLRHYIDGIKQRTKENLNDEAVNAESFFKSLLNLLYNFNLSKEKIESAQNDTIDLHSIKKEICVQVTAQNNKRKIDKTITNFIKKRKYATYKHLHFFILDHTLSFNYDIDKLKMWGVDITLHDISKVFKKIKDDFDDYNKIFPVYDFIMKELDSDYSNQDLFSTTSRSQSDIFQSKEIFKRELIKILEDDKSDYYIEIRQHWNSYSLVSDCYFLKSIITDNIDKAMEYGLLRIISDFTVKHLNFDEKYKHIYNQPHTHPLDSEDEGFDLPIYYHIQFIGILYTTSILEKVDISSLSQNHNILSIYERMIEIMLNNIIIDEIKFNNEYPTNYHWLIKEMFSVMKGWIETFGDKHPFIDSKLNKPDYPLFSSKSSYLDFTVLCAAFSLDELYKGFQQKKISKRFITSVLHYDILSYYYNYEARDEIKEKIEEEIIAKIPSNLIESVLKYTLDERFAIMFSEFIKENFSRGYINIKEKAILKRLLCFLQKKQLVSY